jgi:hypothetical protein
MQTITMTHCLDICRDVTNLAAWLLQEKLTKPPKTPYPGSLTYYILYLVMRDPYFKDDADGSYHQLWVENARRVRRGHYMLPS